MKDDTQEQRKGAHGVERVQAIPSVHVCYTKSFLREW
jgi:hypothetical protein